MQHSASAGSLLLKDDFDHIFNDDTELVQFLERVGAAHGGDKEMADALLTSPAPISLQFLPPEPVAALPSGPPEPIIDPAGSAVSSLATTFEDLQPNGLVAQQHLKAFGLLGGLQGAAGTAGVDPALLVGAGTVMPPPPPPIPSFPMPASSTASGMALRAQKDSKPQVSHSTVEKQRRDRINALIDELRDLVPPSKSGAGTAGGPHAILGKDAASNEARRPKHVVLADTIALLKSLQSKAPLSQLLAASQQPGGAMQLLAPPTANGGQAPTANGSAAAYGVKSETSPTNSNSKGSVSSGCSREDMDMKEEPAAPKLPKIPIQPTMLSGVMVERGPDCMYVQIKCRDRKGLLLDIINALKLLPLEVRTAAVTTQADGMVRDVFEVCVDDSQLLPEDVQNMVHEAVFQARFPSPDAHKRQRC